MHRGGEVGEEVAEGGGGEEPAFGGDGGAGGAFGEAGYGWFGWDGGEGCQAVVGGGVDLTRPAGAEGGELMFEGLAAQVCAEDDQVQVRRDSEGPGRILEWR